MYMISQREGWTKMEDYHSLLQHEFLGIGTYHFSVRIFSNSKKAYTMGRPAAQSGRTPAISARRIEALGSGFAAKSSKPSVPQGSASFLHDLPWKHKTLTHPSAGYRNSLYAKPNAHSICFLDVLQNFAKVVDFQENFKKICVMKTTNYNKHNLMLLI